MDSAPTHRSRARVARAVAARGAGVWLVTAVLFATFVSSEHAVTRPLTTGSWLTAVALSGIFCAAWVVRDSGRYPSRTLVRVWVCSVLVVTVALCVAGLVTNTERSRAEGYDLVSAMGTSALIGVGLGVAVVLGMLCGRAVAKSTGSGPVPD